MSDYRVLVKPSARRVSATAGAWVNRHGPTRTFGSKALAREWARVCATPTASVWVQDAPSWADDEADGYLVGATRTRVARHAAPGRQESLAEGAGEDDR